MSFDFNAILLNETLDDPITTNVPTSWEPFLSNPSTIQNLFRILTMEIGNQQSSQIKMKAA